MFELLGTRYSFIYGITTGEYILSTCARFDGGMNSPNIGSVEGIQMSLVNPGHLNFIHTNIIWRVI